MKEPFKEYICDVCGKRITVDKAMLQWLQKKSDESTLETLVDIHVCCNRKPCDSLFEERGIKEDLHEQWDHLNSFVGTEHLDKILTFPCDRIIPDEKHKEILSIMRRLAVPYYEEARQYFTRAEYDGFIERLSLYEEGHDSWREQILKAIIEKYSNEYAD